MGRIKKLLGQQICYSSACMKWLIFLFLISCGAFADEEMIQVYGLTQVTNGVGARVTFAVPATRFFEVPTWVPR